MKTHSIRSLGVILAVTALLTYSVAPQLNIELLQGKRQAMIATTQVSYSKLLILGNSMTKYPYSPPLWYASDRGMAASVTEADFAHRLTSLMRASNSPALTTDAENIAAWENNFDSFDLTTLAPLFTGVDLIVFRLGENVTYSGSFQAKFQSLVEFAHSQAPNARILICSTFWTGCTDVNTAMHAVATALGLEWLTLDQLDNPNLATRSFVGATYIGDDMATHTISDIQVANHPSDNGMLRIAELIYDKLVYAQPDFRGVSVLGTSTGVTDSVRATTTAMDTTGANRLVVIVNTHTGGGTPRVLDLSKGNVFTLLGSFSDTDPAGETLSMFECVSPLTGIDHQFQASTPGVSSYPSIIVYAIKGADTNAAGVISGAVGTHTVQTGSLTPSANGSLLITGMAIGGRPSGVPTATQPSVNSGFTVDQYIPALAYAHVSSAAASQVQTTAAPINPLVTVADSDGGIAAALVVIKPLGPPTSPMRSNFGERHRAANPHQAVRPPAALRKFF